MISVLIPVYNFDIRLLIKSLYQQLLETNLPFEILCFDDGSQEKFRQLNEQVNSYASAHIRYEVLPENIGRARIRNALAKAAQFPYLLFMDCDSGIVSEQYIQTYLTHLQSNTVLYGGRCYAPTPPDRSTLRFHWHYGTHREQIPPEIRRQQPYYAFMTNNFLIPKAVFDQIRFDERLRLYGHEDTLFGLELEKRGIPILHLENALEHLGLEERDIFLEKTAQGITNLAFIAKENPMLQTRLLNTYKNMKKRGLLPFATIILEVMKPYILKKLKADQPDLRWFDLYKLRLFIRAYKRAL